MFKKVDYLVMRAYIGPFILSFAVVTFILLLHFMLGYISELIGKDLGLWVYGRLIMYFSFNVMQMAFPLSILISSLIAYGNLGEHFELTALKASGVSLLRTLRPIFFFVLFVTGFAFFISNNVVPYANLKAYSLLWDAKMKKPSVSFTEGMFYYGLDGYAIKVGKKYNDEDFGHIIINNFSGGKGNTEVVLAKSGKIQTVNDKSYLKFQLYNGSSYSEVFNPEDKTIKKEFVRTNFDTSVVMFSLESFQMNKTDESLFKSNEVMMNTFELSKASDSIQNEIHKKNIETSKSISSMLSYQHKKYTRDSIKNVGAVKILDFNTDKQRVVNVYNTALNNARNVKNIIQGNIDSGKYLLDTKKDLDVEFWMKFTHAAACIIMFLIGAPLGSIIKKGGLGSPLIVSVIFFVVFYICTLLGKQLVKEANLNLLLGMWLSDIVLLPFGILFLFQAKNDSRLFEFDFKSAVQKLFPKKKTV
jgi:lipopolysaccharide export system permease protein